MLILSLVLGLVLGLFAGGKIDNLAFVRLRLVQLLFLGLILRYATQFAIENGNDIADATRLPLFATGFLLLLIGLWANREHPGIALAFVGILLNAVAIVTNGGYMPVWQPSIARGGPPRDGAWVGIPRDRRDGNERDHGRLPGPGGTARRHHPDPDPVHPQRRQHR